MGTISLPSDLSVNAQGYVSLSQVSLPSNCVRNAQVASDAAIAVGKVVHLLTANAVQASGADVASKTELVYCCRASGGATIVDIAVAISTAPTGGDKQYTVDVQKSTGGGSFASILSAVETISSADTSRTVSAPTISSASLVQGDILQVVVTASGSTGSQGQGVVTSVRIAEASA